MQCYMAAIMRDIRGVPVEYINETIQRTPPREGELDLPLIDSIATDIHADIHDVAGEMTKDELRALIRGRIQNHVPEAELAGLSKEITKQIWFTSKFNPYGQEEDIIHTAWDIRRDERIPVIFRPSLALVGRILKKVYDLDNNPNAKSTVLRAISTSAKKLWNVIPGGPFDKAQVKQIATDAITANRDYPFAEGESKRMIRDLTNELWNAINDIRSPIFSDEDAKFIDQINRDMNRGHAQAAEPFEYVPPPHAMRKRAQLFNQDYEREDYVPKVSDEVRHEYYSSLLGPEYRSIPVYDYQIMEDTDVGTYIDEDEDNIVFIIKGEDGVKTAFVSLRSEVRKQMAMYDCDMEDNVYINLANLGYQGTGMADYDAVKAAILYSNYQIILMQYSGHNTGKLITHEIRYFEDTGVGGFHCQEGTQAPYYQTYIPEILDDD